MRQLTKDELEEKFGKFRWRPMPGNYIEVIDKAWLKNIVEIEVPILGKVRCHREVLHNLFLIFYRIKEKGLASYVDVQDYHTRGGCYVARCRMWDCNKGIGPHAFGVALDLNVAQNPYGQKGKMHPGIIEEFAREGWLWGGRWKVPDPMHFEVSNLWKPLAPVIETERR